METQIFELGGMIGVVILLFKWVDSKEKQASKEAERKDVIQKEKDQHTLDLHYKIVQDLRNDIREMKTDFVNVMNDYSNNIKEQNKLFSNLSIQFAQMAKDFTFMGNRVDGIEKSVLKINEVLQIHIDDEDNNDKT